jgi:catechol 2,3-dioxygenase-like lactoylglutathione lyase family enzyme
VFLGLRTVIYPAPDLARSTAWFTAMLGQQPYFDEPFYVGFQVAGYELGLDPSADPARGPVTYWGVPDADIALAALLDAGAIPDAAAVQDVGDGIRVATVREPGGSLLGIIENPHFRLPTDVTASAQPGR